MDQVLWFGWFRVDIIDEYAQLFWSGLGMTILVTVICIVQGTGLGLLLGMARLADARHATDLPLCSYLLQMRELYRWEQALPLRAPLARDAVAQSGELRQRIASCRVASPRSRSATSRPGCP